MIGWMDGWMDGWGMIDGRCVELVGHEHICMVMKWLMMMSGSM